MKKIWKTLIIVVLVMIVLGGVTVGVAFVTGADFDRVQSLFNATYNVSSFKEYCSDTINNLLGIVPLT